MDKVIYTIQHTQSEHHVNGKVGAWGDWNLTELGKEQARQIGLWLSKKEKELQGFKLYTSDLKRTVQTAEEIRKLLGLEDSSLIKSVLLRERNLGQANGKSREWYNEHVAPEPQLYNPDFRLFSDAESDRELWERLHKFYQELMTCQEEKIIIVSHGGALPYLHAMLIGDSFEDTQKRKLWGHSGGVSRFVLQADGVVQLSYLNNWVY
ncbi:MAG: histidine phosphatase family protein [Treponemataceae bacterium]|nr:histidine phosphatase family protein [Treponemataceae bacterium]